MNIQVLIGDPQAQRCREEVRFRATEQWLIQTFGEDRLAEWALHAVVGGYFRTVREAIAALGRRLLEAN